MDQQQHYHTEYQQQYGGGDGQNYHQQQNPQFDDQAAHLQNQLQVYQQQQQDAAEKMQALQTYVSKYGARLDVHHKSKYTPQAEQPNLGTAVPSWYYLDGRGNKIFVQDMTFDNALQHSKAGRGMSARSAHAFEDQEVVVVVPRTKRNPAWHAEYLRRCEEYEAAKKRLRGTVPNPGRVAIPEGHRLIGDGVPSGHTAAFDALGRKGQGSLWDARQSQAKILGSSPRRQITAGPSSSSSMMVPYQQPQFLGSGSSNGVLPAVMVDPSYSSSQQQQQQIFYDPYNNHNNAAGDNNQQQQQNDAQTAALQEEAARLLAQLNHQ